MGAKASNFFLFLLAALCLLHGTEGYARLHTRSCDAMPTREQYPKIPHNSGELSATVVDGEGGAEFQVKNVSGDLVTEYNAGGELIVTVKVPLLSSAVAMVPVGQLQDTSRKAAVACEGRRIVLGEGRFTGYLPNDNTRRFTFLWSIPRDASGDLTLLLGYSDKSSHAIYEARATLTEGEPYSAPIPADAALAAEAAGSLIWSSIELEVMSVVTLVLYLACLIVGHHVVTRARLVPLFNRWLFAIHVTGPGSAVVPSHITVGDVVIVLVTSMFLLAAFGLRPTTTTVASHLGWVCTFSMTITMIPTGRRSFFAKLHGAPFNQIVHLHRWGGTFFMMMIVVHAIQSGFEIGWDLIVDELALGFQRLSFGYGYAVCILPGLLSSILFLFMTVMSIDPIRRRCWEAFRNAHHLAIPAVVLAILHSPRSVWIVSFSLVAWLVDGVWRLWGKDFSYHAALTVHSGGTVRIHVPGKGTRFDAQRVGQYCLLRFPEVNKLQWHPLTIASSPIENHLDFLHKARGNWGDALLKLAEGTPSLLPTLKEKDIEMPDVVSPVESTVSTWLEAGPGPVAEHMEETHDTRVMVKPDTVQLWLGPGVHTTCNIDGPYGGLPVGMLSKDILILVAGGVGVTPMMSTAAYLCAWAEAETDRSLPHVHFVWMSKGNGAFLDWDLDLLRRMSALSAFSLHLFDTTSEVEQKIDVFEEGVEAIAVNPGRCELDKRFCMAELAGTHHDASRTVNARAVAVCACGPASLCIDAGRLAKNEGYAMHAEAFEW